MEDLYDVAVSVYVPTYNHEKYIVKALDSILMQKCSFPIEILVGEDASTDNTRSVLKEYEREHSENIRYFYRENNMSRLRVHNAADLRLRCSGKYIIALEGDDYWIDPFKLQKQYDFLQSHPDYIAVAHRTIVVDENNNQLDEIYPECTDDDYTLDHYLIDIMPGQLTTVMMRNPYKLKNFDTSFIDKGLTPGDKAIYFSLASQGKVACLQEKMSCYRHITTSGTSYSAKYRYNFPQKINWYREQLQYAKRINNKAAIIVSEAQYSIAMRTGFTRNCISLKEYMGIIKDIHPLWAVLGKIVYRDLKIKR